jgi:hypothetical protein
MCVGLKLDDYYVTGKQGMRWPIPEYDIAQIRAKEREAAQCGGRDMDAVAKMYEQIGRKQQAIDCYNLAKREDKAQRLTGVRVHNVEETLSVYDWLRGPQWYPSSPHVWSCELIDEESFAARLYAQLSDLYLALVSYLDSGMEAPFRFWRERGGGSSKCDGGQEWSLEIPGVYPGFGRCGWNIKWTADLAKRSGRSTDAARILKTVQEEHEKYTDDFSYCDSAYDATLDYLERGFCEPAIQSYRYWLNEIEYSDIPGDGLFVAPALFYTAGDMIGTLDALSDWQKYAKEHPEEANRLNGRYNGLPRLKVLALWRLGKISEAAGFFERLIKGAADENTWEDTNQRFSYSDYDGDLSALATLRDLAGDTAGRDEALNICERIRRESGRWYLQVIEYYFRGLFDQMERVCREEDELDIAVHLYEKAERADDAARVRTEVTGNVAEATIKEKIKGPPGRVEISDTVNSCSACGAETSAQNLFCGDCGNRLTSSCPNCGAELQEGKKYCVKCGLRVG